MEGFPKGKLAGGGFPKGKLAGGKSKVAKQSGASPHFEGGGKVWTKSKKPGWWPGVV